jgi:hypothetical protein
MAIIRFDESLHDDPRVWEAGTEAFGLWVMSVGYVTRHCCEVYPHSEALFTDSRGRLTPPLIAAGLWEWAEDDSGYVVLCPTVGRHSKPAYTIFVPHSDVPPEIRRAVFARDGHACLICGDTDDLTLDHIWPQVLGGEHTMENLRVLCRSCNSRKGARV